MSFKFELNLKKDEGIVLDDNNILFRNNPTFEKIVEVLKREGIYKEVVQLEDFIIEENEEYKDIKVYAVYEDNTSSLEEISIYKYKIVT